MISTEKVNLLFDIVSDATKSFEYIASNFEQNIKKPDQFEAGLTLWFLIKDDVTV